MLAARFVLGPGARQGGAPGGPAGVLLVKITPPESYGEHISRYPNDAHIPYFYATLPIRVQKSNDNSRRRRRGQERHRRGKHNTYLHDAQNPGSLSWSFQRIVSPDRNGTNLPPANGYAAGGVHVSRFSTTLSLLRGNP